MRATRIGQAANVFDIGVRHSHCALIAKAARSSSFYPARIRCERRGNTDGGLAADMSLAPGCRTALVLGFFLFPVCWAICIVKHSGGLCLILISPLHHPKVSFWKKKGHQLGSRAHAPGGTLSALLVTHARGIFRHGNAGHRVCPEPLSDFF